MSALAALVKSAGVVGANGPQFLVGSIFNGQLAKVARTATSMHAAQFTEQEVMRIVKALYLSDSKQDARDAWAVLDRRKIGSIPRVEIEESLVDIFGDKSRRRIRHLLDRLPSKSAAFTTGTEQMVESAEFIDMLPKLAGMSSSTGSILSYLAQETAQWLGSVGDDMVLTTKACSTLELETVLKLPPSMMARAGAVVERMSAAGYTPKQTSVAVEALYGNRDPRRMARLWGLFDVERQGRISVQTFDAALPLLTDAVTVQGVAAVRAQMGFVDPSSVTIREFEAALRLLVPADGSDPQIGGGESDASNLVEILGGTDNVSRLKPFQRQRATRLAQRMRNFGYSPGAISTLCKTLFLTKLHDKDLWHIWVLLHPEKSASTGGGGLFGGSGSGGNSLNANDTLRNLEQPLDVEQVRHLLALLSEANKRTDVDGMLEKVDSNGSGDIEFEEMATLIRAVNPQLARHRDVADVQVEAHPLLQQVQELYEKALWGLMYATKSQLDAAAKRANILSSIVKRLNGTAHAGISGAGGKKPGGSIGSGAPGGFDEGTTVDRATLAMIHDVADSQMAAAAEGERRGSLEVYCTDAQTEALAQYAQALRHAANMLTTYGYDTYESHVALRTVRTVEMAERLHPQRMVEWRMDETRRGGASLLTPPGAPRMSEESPQEISEEERARRALCLSYEEGGGVREMFHPAGVTVQFPGEASPARNGRAAARKGKTAIHAETRRRAQEVYRGRAPRVGADSESVMAEVIEAKTADAQAHHQLDWARATEAEQMRHAAEMAAEAMGKIAIGPTKPIGITSSAGEAFRHRQGMLKSGSSAAKVADAMADEKPEAIQLAAKMHQRVLCGTNKRRMLQGIILGVR